MECVRTERTELHGCENVMYITQFSKYSKDAVK